jgi:hypothetical protein
MLKPSTYTMFDIGINFVVIASEDFPQKAVEADPIILPRDSGYSAP